MTDQKRIAYGFDRKPADFTGRGVGRDKIFIDTDATEREELRAALAATIPGAEVIVLALSDFGRGAMAAKIRGKFEANGGTVVVAGEAPRPRGRPASVIALSPEDYEWARGVFLEGVQTRADLVAKINRKTGLALTWSQWEYEFIRKPRRRAAKER